MPFQVAFSFRQNKPPAVTLLSAGADQQVFCGTFITLSAIVNDELLLPGHPLEWEQLSGNPVILTCPTCLTTTYPLIDLSDKTFRFWIDRGTPDEQYDDVDVFHTPTSIAPTSSWNARGEMSRETPSSPVDCNSFARFPGPPILQQGEAADALDLEWDPPPRVDIQPFITQYTVFEDDVNVQETPPSIRVYPGVGSFEYKVLTEYNINGQYSSEMSCTVDYSNDDPILVLDDYAPTSSQIAAPTFSRINYGNITITDPLVTAPTSSQIAAPTFSRINYGNITITDPLVTAPTSSQIAKPTAEITRYDSGGIGG